MSEQTTNDSRQESAPNQDEQPKRSSILDQTQAAMKLVMQGVKNSNALPIEKKRDLYETYSSFPTIMNKEGKRILQLIHMVMQHQNIKGNIIRRDVEEKFELLIEANDTIFEKVETTLDELSGIRKNPEPVLVNVSSSTRPVSGSWNKNASSVIHIPAEQEVGSRLLTAKNIERPQGKFKDKVDNSNTPWIPGIKYKPNNIKPLAITCEVYEDGETYCHPYQYELDRFTPPEHQLIRADPIKPRDVNETPLIIVESPEQINDMLEDLQAQSMIGVDVEHHSYRSFQGFTCLLQISTREKDYIIDALSLRSDLHVLNEVFTSPKILKVFHGARSDIEWLQHDLNVYVVNMFDTHEASKSLNFPRTSLAYLLKHYCNFDANKQFQFADWRIRPLPQELLDYARSDTHYILYIHDMMRNALLDERNGLNLLKSVYQRSTEVCLRRYFKNIFTEDSHLELYRRSRKNFDNRQMYAFKHIYEWRDRVAREEDDSIGFVLPNHMMLNIAESLPREAQGILACCNPIPPLVRQYLLDLHMIVLKAREQPLVKPVIEEELRTRPLIHTWSKLNIEDPLYCPHDLSQHDREIRDDLPTLLEFDDQGEDIIVTAKRNHDLNSANNMFDRVKTIGCILDIDSANDMESPKSRIEVFNSIMENGDSSIGSITNKLEQVKFLSPFERYKRARAYMDAVEREKGTTPNGNADNQDQTHPAADKNSVNEPASTSEAVDEKIVEELKNLTPASVLSMDTLPLSTWTKGRKRKIPSLRTAVRFEEPKAKSPKTDAPPGKQKRKRNKRKVKPTTRSDTLSKQESRQGKQDQTGGSGENEPQTSTGNSTESKSVDIKQVDFSRFRGGSLPEKRHNEVEARFQGKRKKKGGIKGKKGNKRTKHQ